MKKLETRFVELTPDMGKKTKLDNIYIIDNEGGYRSLTSLYVKVKDDTPKNVVRKITSIEDFRSETKKNNVFFNIYATDPVPVDEEMHEPILYADEIEIPNTYHTVKYNQTPLILKTTARSKNPRSITATTAPKTIPYGLKRTLPVRSLPLMIGTASAEASHKINKNVKYVYAKADEGGKWDFYEIDTLTYYDGKEQKSLREALTNNVDLSSITLFDANGDPLSQIYTEQGFYFGNAIAQEELDLIKGEKKVYTIQHDGEPEYTTEKIPNKYSMQRYITKIESDEATGKPKQVSYVRTKNYHANENGDYLAIRINGQVTMIHKDDVLDKDGNPIKFLDEEGKLIEDSSVLGNPIYIKNGDDLLESDPITYEQLMVRYETYKSYQPTTEKVPTEETYLRIDSVASDPDSPLKGRYIKELESVQPICYTVVADDAKFDKYLVKMLDGSKWVCVDKEYFEKNKAKKIFDVKTYRKVQRCDYNSSKCHIMQTTSKESKVEDCVIISRDLAKEVEEEVADKKLHFDKFIQDYKDGKYQLNDLYLNGELVKLAPDKTRYLYTDEAEFPDYANETARFRAYNTTDFTKKDGKLKGGPKFNTKKVLTKRYKKLGLVTGVGAWYLYVGGCFFPALVPVFAAFLGIAAVGAITLPMMTGIQAFFKNMENSVPLAKRLADKKLIEKAFAKCAAKMDKTKFNRKQEEKAIKRELKALYKKGSKLTPLQFEDAMARLKHRIDNFAETGSATSLTIKNGKLQENANNIGLAIAYKKAVKRLDKSIKSVEDDIKKCFKKDGKTIKPSRQKKYDALTEKLNGLKEQKEVITNKTMRADGHSADKRGDKLDSVARDLQLHRIAQTPPLPISDDVLGPKDQQVLQKYKWSAEKGLHPTLLTRVLHPKEVKEIKAKMPTIREMSAKEYKVEVPLSEQVEAKQVKLDAGREILHERTKDLGAVEELVHETAEGYKSAGKVEEVIAGAEQEIAEDRELLDGKFTLEQIDENVQTIEGHTQHGAAEVAMDDYVTTIEQIRKGHAKLMENLERLKDRGNISDVEIEEIDEYIERTLNADMPEMENMEALQATLKGVEDMNAEVEVSLGDKKETETEATAEQPEEEKSVVETSATPEPVEEEKETTPITAEPVEGEETAEESGDSKGQKVKVVRKKKSKTQEPVEQADEESFTV